MPVCGIMYYTYILRSKKDNSFYIGQTEDLEKRLSMHNKGLSRSTRFRRPYELVFYKEFETRKEAIRYERYLKSLKKRAYIEKLIGK